VIDNESSSKRWSNAERVSILPGAFPLYYYGHPGIRFLRNDLPIQAFYDENPKLQSLSFANCMFLSYIPAEFFVSNLSLKYLDLSQTHVEYLPNNIRNLKKLEFLNLSNTKDQITAKGDVFGIS
jgi:Leucine rich repeat